MEWAVTGHHYRSRAAASWPRLARRPFQVNGVASIDEPMRADGRAFSGFSSDCPMRWVPESGGSPLGTLHVQATAHCRSGIRIRGKDMHAEEETKHAGNRGHRIPNASRLPSELDPFVWLSGAPIGQQASFKQSVPALRCRPCLSKGLIAYKIKVKSRFVSHHSTTTMASSF